MTYEVIEYSEELGSPVELFEFQYGINYFRYVNQDTSFFHLGTEYFPTNISISPKEESSELARNNRKILVPRDLLVTELFRVYPPSYEVYVRVFRVHRNDPIQEKILDWDGTVLNCTWVSEKVELHCENILTSFRRKGLRRPFQPQCPHDLYSVGSGLCNADKEAQLIEATVQTVNGVQITAAEIAAESPTHFRGGLLEWEQSEDVWVIRHIKYQDDGTIFLAQPIFDLVAGDVVHLYPGCAHDLSADGCPKFTAIGGGSNVPNYGGTPIAAREIFKVGIG